MPRLELKSADAAKEQAILTKATLRAADALGLSAKSVAGVIGLSAPTMTRMRTQNYELERGSKAFELAVLFVRMYRSLDAMSGGEDRVARSWLRGRNTDLNARPVDMIASISGLTNVIAYLDAARARV
jgi:Protein of unknown function (DUF2384)